MGVLLILPHVRGTVRKNMVPCMTSTIFYFFVFPFFENSFHEDKALDCWRYMKSRRVERLRPIPILYWLPIRTKKDLLAENKLQHLVSQISQI